MKYLLERGVDLEFAIKILRVESAQMWYPRHCDLFLACVLSYADLVVARGPNMIMLSIAIDHQQAATGLA